MPIAASNSLLTMSLSESKIASAVKCFCVILDRSQVLIRVVKEKIPLWCGTCGTSG